MMLLQPPSPTNSQQLMEALTCFKMEKVRSYSGLGRFWVGISEREGTYGII